MARDGVTAPIASATSLQQLQGFVKAASLALQPDDLRTLDEASAPAAP
jgi:aryl-alcohol dehydrogenase-like predicted oxidoreductase